MERDRETIEVEIAALDAKAKARRGKIGFSQNLKDIEARKVELQAELEALPDV